MLANSKKKLTFFLLCKINQIKDGFWSKIVLYSKPEYANNRTKYKKPNLQNTSHTFCVIETGQSQSIYRVILCQETAAI